MIPRVMHLVISLAPGGLERLVVDWTLERNRIAPGSTSVCCLDEPGVLAAELPAGVVLPLGARRGRFPCDVAAVRRLRRLLATERVCVVHSHNAAALHYAAAACWGSHRRHIHTEHGTNPHARGAWGRLKTRRLLWRAAARVAVCESAREALCRDFGMPAEAFEVIPNGVRAGERRQQPARAVKRNIVVGCVGRLAEVKGPDRLIKAFAAAFASDADVVLQLVGDGPLRATLEALGQRLGLADRVVFMGFRADARMLMRAMDLVVVPSRSEGLSVALLEAMAEGVPAAATAVGENACVLDAGRCGMLLPGDETRWPEALASIVRGLRADEGVWRERVDAARTRVRDVYSLERTVEAYESLYAGIEAG